MHVATNAAARGLGISNVDLVIHYELPDGSETFVHYSGHTGCIGNESAVILIFTSSLQRKVKECNMVLGQSLGCLNCSTCVCSSL